MGAISNSNEGKASERPAAYRAVENVYRLIGGIEVAARIAGRHVSRAYRWREEGVSRQAMRKLLRAAPGLGVDIEPNDFFNPARLDGILADRAGDAVHEKSQAKLKREGAGRDTESELAIRKRLFGCMKGILTVDPDYDFATPVDVDWGEPYLGIEEKR